MSDTSRRDRWVLVLASGAADDVAGTIELATAAAERADAELVVLAWHDGDQLEPSPYRVIDADVVNRWAPGRLLARAGLRPVARFLKGRRLRALLRPLVGAGAVVVDAPAGLDAVAWLPRPRPPVTLLARAAATRHDPAVLSAVDHIVVTQPDAERWATDGDVADGRMQRLALLPGEPAPDPSPTRLGLAGWSAAEVAEVAATLAARGEEAFTWFVEAEAAWPLWQGATASPVAGLVEVAEPQGTRADLEALRGLVIGDPSGSAADLAGAAEVLGVPVTVVGPRAVTEAVTAARSLPEPAGPLPGWTIGREEGVAALARVLRDR